MNRCNIKLLIVKIRTFICFQVRCLLLLVLNFFAFTFLLLFYSQSLKGNSPQILSLLFKNSAPSLSLWTQIFRHKDCAPIRSALSNPSHVFQPSPFTDGLWVHLEAEKTECEDYNGLFFTLFFFLFFCCWCHNITEKLVSCPSFGEDCMYFTYFSVLRLRFGLS